MGKWASGYDPTRQINNASGGNFRPVGNIDDAHQYPIRFPFNLDVNGRFNGFVKVVGEFGGMDFRCRIIFGTLEVANWGYCGLPKDKEEWLQRFKTSIKKIAELKKQRIAAGIFTQTTDVESEINGLFHYDRKVQKMSPRTLAGIHKQAAIVLQSVFDLYSPKAAPAREVDYSASRRCR